MKKNYRQFERIIYIGSAPWEEFKNEIDSIIAESKVEDAFLESSWESDELLLRGIRPMTPAEVAEAKKRSERARLAAQKNREKRRAKEKAAILKKVKADPELLEALRADLV